MVETPSRSAPRLDPRTVLIAALLGVLVWQAGVAAGSRPDGGGGDANRDIIAVTGDYGNGTAALYVIDTKTRHLAVYRLQNGSALQFVAARNMTYDFYLDSLRDESERWLKPSALRQSWQEFNERAGRTTPPVLEEDGEAAPGPGKKPGGK